MNTQTQCFIYLHSYVHELVANDECHAAQRCKWKNNMTQWSREFITRCQNIFERRITHSPRHFLKYLCRVHPIKRAVTLTKQFTPSQRWIQQITDTLTVKAGFDKFTSIYLLTLGKFTSLMSIDFMILTHQITFNEIYLRMLWWCSGKHCYFIISGSWV